MAAALGWIQPVLRPSRFDGERITEVTWERFFSREEPVHAHVAMHDGCLVGIAHFLFHRSTTRLTDVCYLQDLFTAEEARGRGVGRRLIESVFDVACAAGSSRVYWQTKTTMFQVARFTTRSRSTRDLLSIHTRFSRRLANRQAHVVVDGSGSALTARRLPGNIHAPFGIYRRPSLSSGSFWR